MTFRIEPDPTSIYFRCVEDCNDAMMLTDAEGAIVYVNPAWERTYGYSKAEAVGKRASLLHSGKHDERFYAAMWKAISNPKVGYWKGEVVNRMKNGALISVLLMITPFRQPDGAISGYIGIATDMTARKKLEASLRHQESLAAVRQFAEGLAHELGTILGVIRGRAEFMHNRANEPSIVVSGSDTVIRQADRVSRIIGYLLRFCRTAEPVQTANVAFAPIARDLKALIAGRAAGRPIDFLFDVPVAFRAQGDQRRVGEILGHFAANSVDAIEEAVVLGRTTGHQIAVTAEENDSEIRLSVRDTGNGVADEILDKIFQPYFTTKEIGKSAGLGLAISTRLAQDMEGSITVESEHGAGTTFTLHLPKAT
jgi:PAS domain S-box-containing protein